MEITLKNTVRVVIYGRTQHDPVSLQRQLEYLKGVAKNNGWQIVGVFADLASANAPERQGYSEVLNMAEAKKTDVVLVSDLSRLWRETPTAAKVLDEWQNRGVRVYQAGCGFICPNPDVDKIFEIGGFTNEKICVFSADFCDLLDDLRLRRERSCREKQQGSVHIRYHLIKRRRSPERERFG